LNFLFLYVFSVLVYHCSSLAAQMKAIIRGFLGHFFTTRATIINLFFSGILFQVYLILQKRFFYPLIKVFFVALAAQLLAGFIQSSRKHKFIIVIVLFVIVLRLPFYFLPDGMLSWSDNALEALQCQNIQEYKLAPFFLLEAIRHEGTWKFLGIAYLWDFFGKNYLFYLVMQLVIFLYLMWLLYRIFEPLAEKKALFGLVLLNFVFIELLFNYSLSIEGAPYLEMLLFLVLGFYLFDFEFRDKVRIFLSYYFIFFAVYIHPLAAFFAASFALCTLIYSLKKHKAFLNIISAAAGILAGCFHLFYYYFFFKGKPPLAGIWESDRLLAFSSLSLQSLAEIPKKFWVVFGNIFRYQFFKPQNFFPEGNAGAVLSVLNQAVVYFSILVFIAAFILSVQKILRLLQKKEPLQPQTWPYLFFPILFLALASRWILLTPFRTGQRHNFDLLLLIIFSYFIVLSLLSIKKGGSLKAIVCGLLLLAFASPHYIAFLRMAHHKQDSYGSLMRALEKNRVRMLAGDFGIVYVVHFLSGRKILVSDSLGPLIMFNFWRYSPEMIKEVDNAPLPEKAYLFAAEDLPSVPWRKSATRESQNRLLQNLKKNGLEYKTIKLTDYTLVIPKQKRAPSP
jgi:hypothetical protein